MGTKKIDQGGGGNFFSFYAVHTGNGQEEADTKKGVIIVSKKVAGNGKK